VSSAGVSSGQRSSGRVRATGADAGGVLFFRGTCSRGRGSVGTCSRGRVLSGRALAGWVFPGRALAGGFSRAGSLGTCSRGRVGPVAFLRDGLSRRPAPRSRRAAPAPSVVAAAPVGGAPGPRRVSPSSRGTGRRRTGRGVAVDRVPARRRPAPRASSSPVPRSSMSGTAARPPGLARAALLLALWSQAAQVPGVAVLAVRRGRLGGRGGGRRCAARSGPPGRRRRGAGGRPGGSPPAARRRRGASRPAPSARGGPRAVRPGPRRAARRPYSSSWRGRRRTRRPGARADGRRGGHRRRAGCRGSERAELGIRDVSASLPLSRSSSPRPPAVEAARPGLTAPRSMRSRAPATRADTRIPGHTGR